jgi:hypothetical protein
MNLTLRGFEAHSPSEIDSAFAGMADAQAFIALERFPKRLNRRGIPMQARI